MRDFKAGRDILVDGDLTINNNSHNVTQKLLRDCTEKELQEEKQIRKKILRGEFIYKLKFTAKVVVVVSAIMGIILSLVWYSTKDGGNKAIFTLTLVGSVITVFSAAIKNLDTDTALEAKNRQELKEIKMLIREKRYL